MTNYLKAVLIADDVLEEGVPVYQSNCQTVQKFDYTFEHHCDNWGIPFGTTRNTVITTQLKLFGVDSAKVYIQSLRGVDCHYFTFVFNAFFDPNEQFRLTGYDDAMRVKGMVVDVEENFDTFAPLATQQMLVTIKILVSAVTYLSSNSSKTLQISDV